MIEGLVNANYEPVISLPVHGPAGRAQEIDVVIDTGYNGYLTLPPGLVAELGLPVVGDGEATLADGSEVVFDVHSVTVLWDGQSRYVEADATGGTPLLGMLLLDGHDLSVRVRSGGAVLIQPVE